MKVGWIWFSSQSHAGSSGFTFFWEGWIAFPKTWNKMNHSVLSKHWFFFLFPFIALRQSLTREMWGLGLKFKQIFRGEVTPSQREKIYPTELFYRRFKEILCLILLFLLMAATKQERGCINSSDSQSNCSTINIWTSPSGIKANHRMSPY